jgi:hypothetical protein
MKNIYELNQNIYITSDEDIKEGDWFLEKAGRQYPIHWNDVDKLNRHCKKIILTTDPLLDGVQAIDDEFLEWFTKNPSCEYVNFTSHGNEKGTKDYELIIPKKVPNLTDHKGRPMTYWGGLAEPSQEPLEEADYEKLKQSLIEFRKVPITFVPDERMYSAEDMIRFAEFVATYPDKNKNVHGQMLHAKSKYDGSERTIDLLEQFKNK